MKVIRKKLILTVVSMLMLFVTVVTTTYAWFSMNDSAWVDPFELDIKVSDQLLISSDTENFQQMLGHDGIVKAINTLRDEETKITGLDQIVLKPVTSFDGKAFYQPLETYDEMNRPEISYETASVNQYVQMRLYFQMQSSSSGTPLDYELHLKKKSDLPGDQRETGFVSSTQTLRLLNSLTCLEKGEEVNKKSGDTLLVNPVNALRMSVIGACSANKSLDKIIEFTDENDLGSYALSDAALTANNITDRRYSCRNNAMYTYYNHIHNNCLKPMDSITENQEEVKNLLLNRLTDQMDMSLGLFHYDLEKNSYNTLAVDFAIWVEGFDADNIIGLVTTSIDCFLSFEVKSLGE